MLDKDNMIKLADWCKKNGINYLTGYRWFKNGKLPVNGYQTPSGTILVDDSDPFEKIEEVVAETGNDSAVTQLVKKAFDLSKSGAPIEDLATYVISNFKLEKQDEPAPVSRRGKMKPTAEMTQSHFKNYMKSAQPKPEPQMFIPNEEELAIINSEKAALPNLSEVKDLLQGRSLGDTIQLTSTLNAANVSSIAQSLKTNALNVSFDSISSAPPTAYYSNPTHTPNSNISTNYFVSDQFPNEVSLNGPVTYDEARALVNLISDSTDFVTIDRQAKEICKLTRDVFTIMLKAAITRK